MADTAKEAVAKNDPFHSLTAKVMPRKRERRTQHARNCVTSYTAHFPPSPGGEILRVICHFCRARNCTHDTHMWGKAGAEIREFFAHSYFLLTYVTHTSSSLSCGISSISCFPLSLSPFDPLSSSISPPLPFHHTVTDNCVVFSLLLLFSLYTPPRAAASHTQLQSHWSVGGMGKSAADGRLVVVTGQWSEGKEEEKQVLAGRRRPKGRRMQKEKMRES